MLFDQQITYPKNPSAALAFASSAAAPLAVDDLFGKASYVLSGGGYDKIVALSGPELSAFAQQLQLKQRDFGRERRGHCDAAQRVAVALRSVLHEQRRRQARMSEVLRWKIVAEELPDAEETVLGFNESWGDRCCGCFFDGEEWTSVEGASLKGYGPSGHKDPEYLPPTHWAAWPAGPKPPTA